jgi:Flp pilus assembly protein CpaB
MAVIGQNRQLAPTATRNVNLRTPLFIFGVALALVAFLVMFAFGIVFVGRTQPTGSVPVVVAKGNIDAREPITPDMLTLSSLPAAAVGPNVFLHVADLKGSTAVVNIYKGEAISANLVTSDPNAPAVSTLNPYLPIPDGYVAMTLPTSEQQGVGGFIAEGDYINVIAAVNTTQFTPRDPRTVARTVFASLYVIRVGSQTVVQRQGQVQGVASSITVVMSQCDATYMDWLLINATVRYTLQSYHNYLKAQPPADSSCPSTSTSGLIGPRDVDARWHFTSA